MVKTNLKENLLSTDITLREVIEKCEVVELTCYMGNFSSLFFTPLVLNLLRHLSITNEIYETISIYARDEIYKSSHALYIVMPINTARAQNNLIFNYLVDMGLYYYFDDVNIVFEYALPEKFKDDYDNILSSNYDRVSKDYLSLCNKLGLAYLTCTKNNRVFKQWEEYCKLIDVPPIVTKDRVAPEFNLEQETYYVTTENKKRNTRHTDDYKHAASIAI